jgi:hypothetical protein
MIKKTIFLAKTLRVDLVDKKNVDLIRDPVFNKGTFYYILGQAFLHDERDRLGLRGLLGGKTHVISCNIRQ